MGMSLRDCISSRPEPLTSNQMTRSRVSLRGSQPGSGESEDESSDPKSPSDEKPTRGRRSVDAQEPMDTEA